ncbi:MAG: aldose 1-epimerase [Clostridia bacterium]|nr:aldose 1-epimerase [Clostridia bacterium]
MNTDRCIVLQNRDNTVTVTPVGARCMQWTHHPSGAQIFHCDSEPILSGIPLLFPVNRIDGGRFVCCGTEYRLPVNDPATGCSLHGTIRSDVFSVTERAAFSCTLRYDSNGEYFGFPQHFSLSVTYTLEADSLRQTVTLSNISGPPLPVLLGFHTAFAIPPVPHTDADDMRVMADLAASVSRSERHLTVGRTPPDDVFDALCTGTYRPGIPISRQFLAGENGTVVLLDTKTGLSVTYAPDPHLRYRLIFSAGRDYLCIEPQTCAVNAVNLPPDSPDAEYPVLSAGASATYVSFISAAYHA